MDERETSGVTTRLVVGFVRERAGEAGIADLLRRAAVPHTAEELEDGTRWVSYDTRIRLFEAAAGVLGDPLCTFAMGATALRRGLDHPLVSQARALGSPQHVYAQLPRSMAGFSTTSTLHVTGCGPTSATLVHRLHEGYEHSRLDCLYAQGLISTVPQIFGLPPARVLHEECESDGAPACVYRLTWSRRRRLPTWARRNRARDPQAAALRGQLEALQSAATDLVSSDDLSVTLQRITQRAAAAVLAPAYLLAIRDPEGGAPLVHSEGLGGECTEELAARLLGGETLGREAVVVEVASSRRSHGYLAALYPPGHRGPADERNLLGAYAGHAAAAIDLLLALENSRRAGDRAAALLALAHQLKSAVDTRTVSDVVVGTLPGFVGCDTSSLLAWDPGAGALREVVSRGLNDAEQAVLASAVIRAEETPELIGILTDHEPVTISPEGASPGVRHLLENLGLSTCIVVPLIAQGNLLAVATACWRAGRGPQDPGEVLKRLRGVAEYATTALQNAQLLAAVRHQSLHDALTGLPNRVLFTQLLEEALLGALPGSGVALLFCDLDGFKQINDRFGHAAGDELLRQVAARFRAAVRPGDTVARLSGDEFAVLLPEIGDPIVAQSLGDRVVACFQEPFRVEGRALHVTTSVGVAVQSGPHGGADDLLRHADQAMYGAKQRGRNQVAVAAAVGPHPAGHPGAGPATPAAAGETLRTELGTALAEHQFRLHFQPLVTVGPGRDPHVVGAEALVRWQHPRLGTLSPGAFLEVAEDTGLVVDMDLRVIPAACSALASWSRSAGHRLHVAVNVAGRTLLDPRLHATVQAALTSSGIAAGQLHLEIAESRSPLDVPAVADTLARLRQLGVRISLDHFGTGCSTLTWLQRLPVDRVKIAPAFTAGLPADGFSLAVVRGVLALAGELGIEVVAGGVETREQLAALTDAGCTLVQGHLLGRPAPCLPEPTGQGR